MSLLSGNAVLAQGVQDISVPFSAVFLAKPAACIAMVSNAVDGSYLAISVVNIQAFTDHFTAHLNAAPNTGNYVINYIAGSNDEVFAAVAVAGQRIAAITRFNGTLGNADVIPFTHMNPIPQTYGLTVGLLKEVFAQIVNPPDSANSPGAPGEYAVDSEFLYVFIGTQWSQIPHSGVTPWGFASAPGLSVDGEFNLLPASLTLQTITYAEAFPSGGPTPKVAIRKIRNSLDSAVSGLFGTVITETHTGFTFLLNATPPTTNYFLSYTAKQG